jgi:hypothetical protein
LFCFTTLSNRNVFSSLSFVSSVLSKQQWAANLDITQRRFFRVDAESNYRSQEFASFLAERFYKIEKTTSRDKHAGGVAERTVGVIAEKTSVAMISPVPPVPQKYWELAMTYAGITMGFNFSSAIGTY